MTDDKVIVLDCATTLDVPCERILNGGIEEDLDEVVVLGWTKERNLYFASSKASKIDILWLIENAKKFLMDME